MRNTYVMFRIGVATVALAGMVLATGVPTGAHHAFGAEFDPNRPVVLRGPVVRVEWVNPHIAATVIALPPVRHVVRQIVAGNPVIPHRRLARDVS